MQEKCETSQKKRRADEGEESEKRGGVVDDLLTVRSVFEEDVQRLAGLLGDPVVLDEAFLLEHTTDVLLHP